jgi:hypothetical protein
LLPNGKVLIAGGSNNSGQTTNTTLLFDPSTGIYTSTGNMTVSRDFHTATLLPNGKVLIAGGRTGSVSSYTYLQSTELYDPSTGLFSASPNMATARYAHTAVFFNGLVLVAGGSNGAALNTAEQYDPVAGSFSGTGSLATPRQYFSATPFLGGTLLVEEGGLNGTTRLASAEPYQGTTFGPTVNMTTARAAHTATVLSDGSVLITGGQGTNGVPISTAEVLK